MTMRVRQVPIDDVKPYPDNPRREHDVVKVAASLKAFGWRQPIVVGPDGYVVAGHGRLLAARELGLDKVPVHVADDLTEEQCRAYRIADNRSAEGSTWDDRLLLDELALLDEARRREAGFDEEDQRMLEIRARGMDAEVLDPNREWSDMPEFRQEKLGFRTIMVHMKSEEDVQAFAEALGQRITPATKYVWFPVPDEVDVTTTTRVVAS